MIFLLKANFIKNPGLIGTRNVKVNSKLKKVRCRPITNIMLVDARKIVEYKFHLIDLYKTCAAMQCKDRF